MSLSPGLIAKPSTKPTKPGKTGKTSATAKKISKTVKASTNRSETLDLPASETPGLSRYRGAISRSLSNSSIRGRGRGLTPLVEKSASTFSVASPQASTSVRAVRYSSVTSLLGSSNCDLLDKSLPELDIGSLESLIQPIGFIDNQTNLNSKLEMASGGNNQEANEVNPSTDGMDALMRYFQESMRKTQEEFRREFTALRETISQNGNREPAPTIRINNGGLSPPSQMNSFSNASTVYNIKLKDWKISYSGEGSVSDFLFKLDTLTQRCRCPEDCLMSNFHVFLTGKAETWYWDYIKQNPSAAYTNLKTAFSKEFGTLETDH